MINTVGTAMNLVHVANAVANKETDKRMTDATAAAMVGAGIQKPEQGAKKSTIKPSTLTPEQKSFLEPDLTISPEMFAATKAQSMLGEKTEAKKDNYERFAELRESLRKGLFDEVFADPDHKKGGNN